MMSTQEYLQKIVPDNSIPLNVQRNPATLHPTRRRNHDPFYFNSAIASNEPFIVDWQLTAEDHAE